MVKYQYYRKIVLIGRDDAFLTFLYVVRYGAAMLALDVILCSKGRVLCWKGKFFRPLNMSCFCKVLCIRWLLIWAMFEG